MNVGAKVNFLQQLHHTVMYQVLPLAPESLQSSHADQSPKHVPIFTYHKTGTWSCNAIRK